MTSDDDFLREITAITSIQLSAMDYFQSTNKEDVQILTSDHCIIVVNQGGQLKTESTAANWYSISKLRR